jgi:fatty acid synthase subunit alpha
MHGIRTFSAKEMAFNILGLCSVSSQFGLTYINKKAELRRAIARDNAAEFKVINGAEAERVL